MPHCIIDVYFKEEMSQVLERLLPVLLRHLSGDITFTTNDHNGEYDDDDADDENDKSDVVDTAKKRRNKKFGTSSNNSPVEPERVPRQKGHEFCHLKAEDSNEGRDPCGGGKTIGGGSSGVAGGGVHYKSAQRWRRCVKLWRHLLGSDRLFLALLFHSGTLWAVEWCPSAAFSSPSASGTGTEEARSWSNAVLWFLQLQEAAATPMNIKSHNDVNKEATGDGVAPRSYRGKTHFTTHMHSEDEVAVQRVAMNLLSEWFAIVDSCGKRFARAYYFSCALKITALVGNMALVEDIPHLHDIVMQEPRSVSQFTAFCSILCCLLVEEAQQQQPFRLKLPPPFFLMNFNLVGRGSRIGVWLPRRSPRAVSGTLRSAAADRGTVTTGGSADCAQEGQFHSCEVCSPGVILRVPSSSSEIDATGDLILGVRLLDEAYVQGIDVLPLMPHDDNEEDASNNDNTGGERRGTRGESISEKRRRVCNRRTKVVSAAAASADVESSPRRCWSASSPLTQSYVRVDLLYPRAVSAIVSPLSSFSPASTGGNGRRRGNYQHQHHAQQPSNEETIVNTVPLRRSSCIAAQRDPLATIVFSLATTARRLMGCRGLFVEKPREHSLLTAAAAVENENSQEERAVECRGKPAKGPFDVDGRRARRQAWGTAEGRMHTTANGVPPTALAFFPTVEEELECLVECAIHLFLEALLLCRALSSDFIPQIDAWATEVTSNTVDLALATPLPVVRHLHAVGYALCLMPQPHQSLLVTVGLFATLAQRQRESNKNETDRSNSIASYDGGGKTGHLGHGSVGFTGWWEVFKACVLKDAVIPGQLCGGTWGLVERVERSLCVTPHVRLHRHPRQPQPQQGNKEGTPAEGGSNKPTAKEADKVKKDEPASRDDAAPRRRLALLHSRRRMEQDGSVKKLKREISVTPPWLRAARAVEVHTCHHHRDQHESSLQEWIMAMWWSLERAATDAA
ncbi:hypothetical protein TcCL_ESM02559 [Trypanosoma cruzi]|uniref:Uncharacterized protein n=3 Tax=Trypanosoma cruzi TaxID=5693 RepID=Q4DW05_TRYCC|nr:hypothetical protein, conserved [Trypanosoma cruzi]AAL96760.1 Tcc1l8.6 [Trypanosoma cruzi]EAN96725.1 hypothetical protein, conserved [Trypanosoma cruzi]RNC59772.1 hypothetical protein TcCL_ESM02559 [Trypanosoma cruzi]|eukprot:XP_818576.1 hypothetical protein [Trypanosoma cruzi strain CL Brener]